MSFDLFDKTKKNVRIYGGDVVIMTPPEVELLDRIAEAAAQGVRTNSALHSYIEWSERQTASRVKQLDASINKLCGNLQALHAIRDRLTDLCHRHSHHLEISVRDEWFNAIDDLNELLGAPYEQPDEGDDELDAFDQAFADAQAQDPSADIRPQHYGGPDDPYEAIKVIEAWGLNFNLGNVLKYISRYRGKGAPVEDLRKARFYLDREIAAMEARRGQQVGGDS